MLEIWGDRRNPSHIRIEFDLFADDDEPPVLLLSPSLVQRADVA